MSQGSQRSTKINHRCLNNRAKGRAGESAAEEYLAVRGYYILEKNFRNRFGEIDIIARDGKTLVFIEVDKKDSLSWFAGRCCRFKKAGSYREGRIILYLRQEVRKSPLSIRCIVYI